MTATATLKPYRVQYALSGFVNPSADETTLVGVREEWYDTLEEAIARGRSICRDIRPGGMVMVEQEMRATDDPLSLEGECYSYCNRYVEPIDGAEWWTRGVDLRS